jgi:hypothetical protein
MNSETVGKSEVEPKDDSKAGITTSKPRTRRASIISRTTALETHEEEDLPDLRPTSQPLLSERLSQTGSPRKSPRSPTAEPGLAKEMPITRVDRSQYNKRGVRRQSSLPKNLAPVSILEKKLPTDEERKVSVSTFAIQD